MNNHLLAKLHFNHLLCIKSGEWKSGDLHEGRLDTFVLKRCYIFVQ